jgi:hypothetical protein
MYSTSVIVGSSIGFATGVALLVYAYQAIPGRLGLFELLFLLAAVLIVTFVGALLGKVGKTLVGFLRHRD